MLFFHNKLHKSNSYCTCNNNTQFTEPLCAIHVTIMVTHKLLLRFLSTLKSAFLRFL